ncbi:hypothetical protein GYMLUDRAFT_380070 [Collybiopsis luxurians FD-317 M1]|nr:hypothetical protein GYMLUDRAFT_380070 [Collybiopsis luxurians FD-317 M1]
MISVSQLPPIEAFPSLKHTHSLYEGNSFPAKSIEYESNSATIVAPQIAPSQYNTSIAASLNSVDLDTNANWSLAVSSSDLGGMPVHIDIGTDIGTDMVASCNDETYGSESTLPNQRLDGMAYGLHPDQFLNQTSSSQEEWSEFMAEVDELLQLVNYPAVGQL